MTLLDIVIFVSARKFPKRTPKRKIKIQKCIYNLGQNEWNISTTPPPHPHFNDAKMAGFGLRAPSSLLWGGGEGG